MSVCSSRRAAHSPVHERRGTGIFATLDKVPLGACVRVEGLDLDGLLRRRLLDLGFVLGTWVRPLRRSPLGDPTAYEVMGAVVALRRSEAARIRVSGPAT